MTHFKNVEVDGLSANDSDPNPAWAVDGTGNLTNDGGGVLDLTGTADALVLDDDGDTTISAPVDDQIDFETGNGDRMTLTDAGLAMAAGARVDEFSTDGTLAGDSDTALPTEQAVKTYVDDLGVGLCEGRLTLTSGSAIVTADQTAKTTVYFTPYMGNRIAIYDGASWVVYEFTEKSVAVPATTVTPFDVFAYISGGAVTLSTTDWTNDTTRATALTTQDGIYVKSGATGYRYLGTGRTTGVNGQTEDSVANRYLWNYYHRKLHRMYRAYNNSHTYNTATWRAFDNAATSVQATCVVGVIEDVAYGSCLSDCTWAAGNSGLYIGVGVNTTGASTLTAAFLAFAGTAPLWSIGGAYPAVGYNYFCPVEYATAAGTAPTFIDTFLTVTLPM